MSHVTDVVLLQNKYLGGEWEKDRLSIINDYLINIQGVGFLVSVDDEKFDKVDKWGEPVAWYAGGGRVLQCNIAIGAFNRLDIPRFLTFLRDDVPWDRDEDGTCQLLLKDEHDSKFTMHDIFESDR